MITFGMIKTVLLILLIVFTNFPRTIYSQSSEIRDDFKKYYAEYQVKGSFVLYDRNADKFIFYNKDQFEKQFTPASTFKICNSLIGLETGIIPIMI